MYCVITQPQGGSYRPHAVRFHSGSLVNVRVKPNDPKLKKKKTQKPSSINQKQTSTPLAASSIQQLLSSPLFSFTLNLLSL